MILRVISSISLKSISAKLKYANTNAHCLSTFKGVLLTIIIFNILMILGMYCISGLSLRDTTAKSSKLIESHIATSLVCVISLASLPIRSSLIHSSTTRESLLNCTNVSK